MSSYKRPVGLPTYGQSERPSQIPTMQLSSPAQSTYQQYRNVPENTENSQQLKEDPYFLEEEEYLEMMSKIIKRDFYPERISEDEKQQLEADSKIQNLSLNQFIRKYKSEDNETFKQIMEKEEQKWCDKYWWMFLAEKKDRINQLALENGDNQEKDTIKRMIMPQAEQKLAITNVESQNSMFFTPKYMSPAVIQKANLDIKEREEKINYQNTRFNQEAIQTEQEQNVHKIVTRMVSDLEMKKLSTPYLLGMGYYDDKNTEKNKNYRYDLEELMHGRNNSDNEKEPKIINGYQIQTMPSPSPNQLASPFITWGEIEDEPIKLNERVSFKIKEVSDREKLATSMANNIQKTKAIQKKQNQDILKKAINSGTPLKVATVLSNSQGNSLVKSILQKKLTGTSGLGLKSSKTPQLNKFNNQTPQSNSQNKIASSINANTQSSNQQNFKTQIQEDTPLLKF
ncbi:hypothetical protein ABPG74_015988 [Tetrahymena malaccensis]